MSTNSFTTWLAGLATALLTLGLVSTAAAAEKLNVILILVDDFGYECVGANGNTSYKTPNLDRLAASGVRFENGHVQPLCTPTRAQLMTGQYNVRNYVRFGLLDPAQKTFAQFFQKAGYATGIVGKWQLSGGFDQPGHFGFDDYCLWQLNRRPPRYANPGLEINGKQVDYSNGEYGPDLVNDHALEFIAKNKDKPFLLYYPMMLTHAPYQPTPDSPDWDPKAKGENVNHDPKHFADMVAYADKLIGRLVAGLEKNGVREKTLLLIVGDNGTGKGTPSKVGDKTVIGGKGTTLDTGTHVPLIVSWPGVMKQGRVCSDLVDSTDFLPTICEAAGIALPADYKPDGRSFLPQLRGEKGNPREWIYVWYARDGGGVANKEYAFNHKYKLYSDGKLYDLTRDLDEKKPLDTAQLNEEAQAARKQLQAALDQYREARPAALRASKPMPSNDK